MDAEGKVVQVCGVQLAHKDQFHNLIEFGKPRQLLDFSLVHTLSHDHRLQEVTIQGLLAAGCTHFCWLLPGEHLFGHGTSAAFECPEHGAFLYIFKEKKIDLKVSV